MDDGRRRRVLARLALLGLALAAVADEPPAGALRLQWDDAAWSRPLVVRRRDGRPLFLRELYSLRTAEDYRIAAFMGFNAAIVEDPGQFPAAAGAGLAVTTASWFTQDTPPAALTALVQAARDQPAIVSYNLNDEPDLRINEASAEALERVAVRMREQDPGARLSVTLSGSGRALAYWPAYCGWLDVVRVDPYPLVAGAPLWQVGERLARARQAAGPAKPVVVVLQAWDGGGAFPTAAQLRQMCWQALIGGASGLSYFDWNYAVWAAHPAFWREVAFVNAFISQQLEPFVLSGQRTEARTAGTVAAALWIRGATDWRILATNLAETGPATTVTLRLPAAVVPGPDAPVCLVGFPADGATLSRRGAREVSLTLAPLACAVLGPTAALGADSPFVHDGEVPAAALAATPGARWYGCDLAGRPWLRIDGAHWPARPVHQVPPDQPYRGFTAGSDAYADAGMSLTADGETPAAGPHNECGPVFRSFPGGRFSQYVTVDGGRARGIRLTAASWHDGEREYVGQELAAMVRVTRLAFRPGQLPPETTPGVSLYRVDVGLPLARNWPQLRDHTLTLDLGFTFQGQPRVTQRVLRYRPTAPFAFGWQWTGPDCGVASTVPCFPTRHYPGGGWHLDFALTAPGLSLTVSPGGERWERRVRLAGGAETTPGLIPLNVIVRAGPDALAGAEVETVHWLPEGRLLTAVELRFLTVHPVPAAPDFAGEWEPLWRLTDRLAPAGQFLLRGARRFAPDEHRAWLLADARCLYWFIESRSDRAIRAETPTPDTSFLADDLMVLLVRGANPPDLFQLEVNPRGVCRHAQVRPRYRLDWNPAVTVRTQVEAGRWRLALAIPWTELGWPGRPAAGTELRLNLGAARSIAPREWFTWAYWGEPFADEESLGRAVLP